MAYQMPSESRIKTRFELYRSRCLTRHAPISRGYSEVIRLRTFLLILIVALEATPSLATRCWARRSVSEELKKSTVVFSGKAVAEEYRPIVTPPPGWSEGGESLVIKFAVERWWKGTGREEVYLYTGVSRWPGGYTRIFSSDFRFNVGEEYLVYAFGDVDHLTTTVCARTTKLEEADEDLKALGEGRLPEKKKTSNAPQAPNKALHLTAR